MRAKGAIGSVLLFNYQTMIKIALNLSLFVITIHYVSLYVTVKWCRS